MSAAESEQKGKEGTMRCVLYYFRAGWTGWGVEQIPPPEYNVQTTLGDSMKMYALHTLELIVDKDQPWSRGTGALIHREF